VKIKSPTFFAYGPECESARRVLSAGAFALYMHLVVNADRRHGLIRFKSRHLVRDSGHCLRATMTHIEEMEAKQVCVHRAALNQYREGEIEICDAFWPYIKERLPQIQSDLQSFVCEVKELLRMRLCITCRFGAADMSFAEKLYVQSVPIAQIKRAVILGCARKYVTLINSGDGELITRLSYFADLINEAAVPETLGQLEIREQLDFQKYETLWGVIRLASIAGDLRMSPELLHGLLNLRGIQEAQAILKRPRSSSLKGEQATRLSCMVQMHNAVMCSRGKIEVEWFGTPNTNHLFGGSSPMQFMMDGGLKNMEAVRLYLYARTGL
jgi:hypothetical protein